jgi:hypothetical protein
LSSSNNFHGTPIDSGLEESQLPEESQVDDPPPFLKTWPRVYRAVIVYLALLIFGLYLVTRAFAPRQGL